jgi:hypothetical protein
VFKVFVASVIWVALLLRHEIVNAVMVEPIAQGRVGFASPCHTIAKGPRANFISDFGSNVRDSASGFVNFQHANWGRLDLPAFDVGHDFLASEARKRRFLNPNVGFVGVLAVWAWQDRQVKWHGVSPVMENSILYGNPCVKQKYPNWKHYFLGGV